MSIVIIVGNPKPKSRTAHAAQLLATAITGSTSHEIIDVVDLGAALLGWEEPAVQKAIQVAANADLLIVASPTFKATYTGLLKLFMDQFATGDGLRATVAVPLMLGAGPAHAMAPDLLLKPLLVELGATCPAAGIYLSDKTYEDGVQIAKYVEVWGSILKHAMAGRAR